MLQPNITINLYGAQNQNCLGSLSFNSCTIALSVLENKKRVMNQHQHGFDFAFELDQSSFSIPLLIKYAHWSIPPSIPASILTVVQ